MRLHKNLLVNCAAVPLAKLLLILDILGINLQTHTNCCSQLEVKTCNQKTTHSIRTELVKESGRAIELR